MNFISNSLTKDVTSYEKEAVDQKRRVEKFKEDAAEEWDIKNGVSSHRLFPINTLFTLSSRSKGYSRKPGG